MTDLNHNLHATGTYSTNFPSPYIDFDDDNGNGEREEAEVTVESSSFPTVGTRYYIQFWFSWAGAAGNAGNIAYTRRYLQRFEDETGRAKSAAELIEAMKKAYPRAGLGIALDIGAKVAKGEMKW